MAKREIFKTDVPRQFSEFSKFFSRCESPGRRCNFEKSDNGGATVIFNVSKLGLPVPVRGPGARL